MKNIIKIEIQNIKLIIMTIYESNIILKYLQFINYIKVFLINKFKIRKRFITILIPNRKTKLKLKKKY